MESNREESLLARIERLESVVEELRKTLEREKVLEQKDHIRERVTYEKPSVPERVREPVLSKANVTREKSAVETGTAPITPTRHRETSIFTEPTRSSRTREEWEALIGGKLLNRIGALALIIGIGFFLKYAFDNNWINETMRVVIGVVTGIALLFGGAHFHKKGLAIFAQGLVGAGIPILYLSVYASFNYYHLVSQTIAFVLMSAVTITAFHQALRYDSFAVSLLGWFGGFLTPFLLNTGEANEIGLFTYIALLDAGLIAVLIKKTSWGLIELLTLAATYITYFLWYGSSYEVAALPATVVFVTLFWGLFYLLDIARIIRPVTSFYELRQLVPSLNAVLFYLALYIMIDREYHTWMAPVTLLIGVVYFLTFQWSQHRHSLSEATRNRYILTAGAMLVIATGIQLSGFMLVAAWSLEGLAMVWYSSSANLPSVWRAAIGLFVLSTIRLYLSQFPEGIALYEPVEGIRFLFNSRALGFIILAASLGFSVAPLQRMKEDINMSVTHTLHYWWGAVLFVLCTVEVYDLFADQVMSTVFLMTALGWTVYSLAMTWPALRMKVVSILHCGLFSLLLAFVLVAVLGFMTFDPIEHFTFALNIRAGIIAFLITAIFIQIKWNKILWPDYRWRNEIVTYLQIALIFLVFVLITGETKDLFEKSIYYANQPGIMSEQGVVVRLENLKQLSLSGVWLVYSILLMGAGMWRRLQGLRIIAIALFGFTILKIFIYDLSFLDALYRIISFIGLGVILLAVSYLYQRYKSVIFESPK